MKFLEIFTRDIHRTVLAISILSQLMSNENGKGWTESLKNVIIDIKGRKSIEKFEIIC